jgi:hypothetical protein
MTPPVGLRIRLEAAFPGATIEQDPGRGDWCVTPASPVVTGGLKVRTMNFGDDENIETYQIALTASAIQSVGRGRLVTRDTINERTQSVTAHDLIAARRRLGL